MLKLYRKMCEHSCTPNPMYSFVVPNVGYFAFWCEQANVYCVLLRSDWLVGSLVPRPTAFIFVDPVPIVRHKILLQRHSKHVNTPPPPTPDSIDTVSAMKVKKDLVGSCNVHLREGMANAPLFDLYLTDMLKVFGVVPESTRFGFPISQQSTDEVQSCFLQYARD